MSDELDIEPKESNEPTYYTKDGKAEPQELSDLQQNNRLMARWIMVVGIGGALGLSYLLWITYYIIKHNVLNNIVSRCVG